jgi:invasion protein IalB
LCWLREILEFMMIFGSGDARWMAGAIGGLTAAAMTAFSAMAALPQPPVPVAPPGTAVAPERTTSVFGDWTVTCTQRADMPKQCEAGLTFQDQQRQVGVVLALGRLTKDQPMQAVVEVPVNIRTAEPVRLVIDGEPVVIPFLQCNRIGCFAQFEMKDDALVRRLRAHNVSTPGRIEWHDGANTEITAPLSTRGFAAAMDALTVAENSK